MIQQRGFGSSTHLSQCTMRKETSMSTWQRNDKTSRDLHRGVPRHRPSTDTRTSLIALATSWTRRWARKRRQISWARSKELQTSSHNTKQIKVVTRHAMHEDGTRLLSMLQTPTQTNPLALGYEGPTMQESYASTSYKIQLLAGDNAMIARAY